MNKYAEEIKNRFDFDYYWIAKRKDGSSLFQFENSENSDCLVENMFSEIDRNPEKFKSFSLISTNSENIFSVDLETGDFKLNGVNYKNNIDIQGNQLRCVYWRRKVITLNLIDSSESVRIGCYFLGWQTTINNHNYKKILKIFADGTVQEESDSKKSSLSSKANIKK
jgi:hypothetical protein